MSINKIVWGILVLSIMVMANTQNYIQAVGYYDRGEHKKAFPLILKEARKGINNAAQYRLAEMYEKGLGTKVDYKKSAFWYKKAADKYAYTGYTKKDKEKESSFLKRADKVFGTNDDVKKGNEYVLSEIDTDTPEVKTLVKSLFDGDFFGLTPYNINYFLPVSYSKDKPSRISSIVPHSEMGAGGYYNENIEVAFQLSLKKQLSFNLFGMNEFIDAAYTQKVWWQLYDASGPFRETNYLPEIFMTIPTSESIGKSIGLKAMRLGFIHESNGQEGYRSRSWNRLYATGMWQWENLFVSTRAWYRLKEDRKSDAFYDQTLSNPQDIIAQSDGDDNPDILDYMGYGDIKINYLYGKSQFGLLLRNNLDFDENKGAVEFTYSYPLFNSPNTNLYFKAFKGYGESLIDYNVDVTKVSFGFSFSNELF